MNTQYNKELLTKDVEPGASSSTPAASLGQNTPPISSIKAPVIWAKLAQYLHAYNNDKTRYILSRLFQGFRTYRDASPVSPVSPPLHSSAV